MQELSTDRCLLNPLRVENQDDVGRLYANQEVRRFLGGALDQERFRLRFENWYNISTGRHWTVRLKSQTSFIGIVSIDRHHDGQEQEISYQFLPEFWGQHLAYEVVSVVIDYAVAVMKLPSIIAETQCANHASCRLLEKVGMEPVKRLIRFGENQIIYRREFSLG